METLNSKLLLGVLACLNFCNKILLVFVVCGWSVDDTAFFCGLAWSVDDSTQINTVQ